MKTTFMVVFTIGFIISIIYYNNRINRLKSEINKNNVDLDSLKKEAADINYNYGLSLTNANCSTCHRFRGTDNLLEGVVERLGEKYLILYLTKQNSLIVAKDYYAISLKEKFGNLGNSHNFKFSPNELTAIIEFMKYRL